MAGFRKKVGQQWTFSRGEREITDINVSAPTYDHASMRHIPYRQMHALKEQETEW